MCILFLHTVGRQYEITYDCVSLVFEAAIEQKKIKKAMDCFHFGGGAFALTFTYGSFNEAI